jgi:hypothetical protein
MPTADYMAEYRKKHEAYKERQNALGRARKRADQRLRHMYLQEWNKLFAEEKATEGIRDA